ncbi:MAG: bacteriohemerythrin [Alphaproteobacteria bacterium]|nr:bacteriohemerythrin [Alphaproteobacteria bacterium]
MPLLEWRDEFSIGIDGVDHEHRALIDLINRLHQEMVEQKGPPRTGAFLGEVHAQIASHFALEEQIMQQQHYAEYTVHKVDHEILLDEIRDIMDAYERGDYAAGPDALGHRLADWFGQHFRSHDARFHRGIHAGQKPGATGSREGGGPGRG